MIYIVRDPRDVAVSQYHYHRKLRKIGDDSRIENFVTRFLAGETCPHGSWGENVVTWVATREGDPRFLLLRCEDMVADTACELTKIAAFGSISVGSEQIALAVQRSSAAQMRKLELASILRGFLALRLCPVPFGLKYVNRTTFRQIANYSGVTFMILVAGRLKFKTDEIVIGTFMSAAAITYFNIGACVVDDAGQVVTAVSQIFAPMSSQSDAWGNMVRMRKIFLVGNRVCGFTIFPVCVILLILGKSVIEDWVGKKYITTSYPVLVIVILCSTLWRAQGASGAWAVVTVVEGISNLILSVILVRPYGIIGDALGTAIPLTCSMLFFMPQHLCKKLDVRLRTFVRESYTLPFILCLPLGGCAAADAAMVHPA